MVWPKRAGALTAFVRWLTHTHTMRWHAHYHTTGSGHLYQGRFKSFPIAADDHFYTVTRYVERNARRANLVARAKQWRWGSLWRRDHPEQLPLIPLADWPLPRPAQWCVYVNKPQTEAELDAIRHSVQRGTPFGSADWKEATARRLDLEFTLHPRGRPRKQPTEE